MSADDRPRRTERRLLDGSLQTRAMMWIMGVMLFLTVLAAAMGLGMVGSTRAIDRDLAGRLTVQIVEADAAVRARKAGAMVEMLRALPMVSAVRPVDAARLAELLRPWLGEAGLDGDVPIPAMIDIDLRDPTPAAVAEIERAARTLDPGANVDAHAQWVSPVRTFIATLAALALGVVLLMAGATTFVVILTARSGLEAHRGTIDILHILGSTDVQVARLFQRRIGIDTLVGGAVGAVGALALVALLQRQLGTLGSQFVDGMVLATGDWAVLVAIPVLFALLATAAARLTVTRALGRMP